MNQTILRGLLSLLFYFFILHTAGGQSFTAKNIPAEAQELLQRWQPQPISVFAFTPTGGWVAVGADGRNFSRNIPAECYSKLKELIVQGHIIRDVSFPPAGGNSWVIVTDKIVFSRNIPAECYQKIQQLIPQKVKIAKIVFPTGPATSNRWLILMEDGNFFARNIDDEAYQTLRNLTAVPLPGKAATRKISSVSFDASGGWAIVAGDYHFTRNIAGDCFHQLNQNKAKGNQSSLVSFSPGGGWAIISNGSAGKAPIDQIRNFESAVGRHGIWQQLRDSSVPGASVAVVMNGQLVWATGYGHLKFEDRTHAVHPESFFQAASVSKVFAAAGGFRLVETTQQNLDDNILAGRSGVSVPVDSCLTNYIDTGSVTIRNILQHRSGIVGRGTIFDSRCRFTWPNSGGGYTGYPQSQSISRLPNLNQILTGSTPANSPPVRITYNRSARGRSYSGDAFTVLQAFTENITRAEYGTWMRENILSPLGMGESRFTVNPESIYGQEELTWGWDSRNRKHVRNRYPEFAAAGLWTNAVELARLPIMLNNGGRIGSQQVLRSDNVTLLRTGTGSFTNDNKVSAKNTFYCHGGANEGYRSFIIGFPQLTGDPNGINSAAIVVLTNGDNTDLRYEIANAVISAYDW